jgi:hypothetical protein
VTMRKFRVKFQEVRTYFTTYEVEAENAEDAVEAIGRGEGDELDDEFESTDERIARSCQEVGEDNCPIESTETRG